MNIEKVLTRTDVPEEVKQQILQCFAEKAQLEKDLSENVRVLETAIELAPT